MSGRRLLVALVAGLILLGTGGGAAAGASAVLRALGGSGIGDPYYPLDGNTGYDVRKYVIRDRMAISTGELKGSTTIHAVAQADMTRFNLDLLLHVDRVVVNGKRADHAKPNLHELRITPRSALAAGQSFTVRVWYHGRPGELSYAKEQSWIADAHEVVAMNEPHIASYWFPANDHPSDKALFDIRITVPAGRQAVSNGVLVSKTEREKWTTWRWLPRDRMATYLAFFTAGRFQLVQGDADGTPYLLAVSRRLSDTQRVRALDFLERTPVVLSWLEERLGDYPFETVGGVVSSLPFNFALETQTRPVYPYVGNAGMDWLVAHELAHQWFGDWVSVARWRDIWLNEGFAQYLEELWTIERWDWLPETSDEWLSQTYYSRAGVHGGLCNSTFWQLSIDDPKPARLFDIAVYQRGAMTLAALRRLISDDEVFWSLMTGWVEAKANGSATIEEFTALAESVTSLDLDAFFQHWLTDQSCPADTPANGLGF